MYNPIRYLSKLIHKLGRGKKLPKNVGFLFHFQVTLQTLTCWAKIRPIWSPWWQLSDTSSCHQKGLRQNSIDRKALSIETFAIDIRIRTFAEG
jgi:hypothetical protein